MEGRRAAEAVMSGLHCSRSSLVFFVPFKGFQTTSVGMDAGRGL